jgi:hypothetical protein
LPSAVVRGLVFGLLLFGFPACQSLNVLKPWEERAWRKAALHTHTVHSDGEASPQAMLRWYRRNGFEIVALTDHNRQMPLSAWAWNHRMLVLPGIEFTSSARGAPVHVNGLFTPFDVKGLETETPREALSGMLAHFAQTGGLAILNHPNYELALSLGDLEGLEFSFLEVFNASSATRNDGDATTPPVESLWDGLLRSGRRVYGVATDDAHALPGSANPNIPGRAWVMVYSRLDQFDVREALERGRFYATTGPILATHRASRSGLLAAVAAQPGVRYRWTIVDSTGVRVVDGPRVWIDRPAQGYRRARLDANDGSRLYLQPIFAVP